MASRLADESETESEPESVVGWDVGLETESAIWSDAVWAAGLVVGWAIS